MKIEMRKTVTPGIPFFTKPGTILHQGEIYQATANKNGAISGICDNGEELGVRPGEFFFVEAPAWILDIWQEVDASALPGVM